MKIAIDITPISDKSTSAHKVRGVGAYITLLKDNLQRIDKNNEYVFFEDKNIPADADLVHYPYFDPFFSTLPLHTSKKFAVTVHDLTPIVFPKYFPVGLKGSVRWAIQKKLLRKARVVMADSISSKNDIVRIVGIPDKRVRSIYLGADKEFKKMSAGDWQKQIKEKYNLPEKFILYVGDATWNKNLPRLVEAVKKADLNLVMIGKIWSSKLSDVSANPWNNDLRSVIADADNNPHIKRLGFVPTEDLVKIYNIASVFIMPSIYEGFGLPLLEAMSCGCPSITSHGGSLPEVGGDAVLYIDEYSAEDIGKKLTDLLNNERQRKELSEKGLIQAKKFSIEKMVKDTVAAYESI